MGLPYGEEIMIVGRTMWTQYTSVTDRRTDRITITKTVQRIASHGKNCVGLCLLPERRIAVIASPHNLAVWANIYVGRIETGNFVIL